MQLSNEYYEIVFPNLSLFYVPIIYGALFIGFGEVIDLLQEFVDKDKPKPEIQEEQKLVHYSKVPFYVEQELKAFYSNKNLEIDTINPTRNRDVFAVEVEGRTEYIEIYSLRILSEKEASKYL